MTALLQAVQQAGEDFEWYPTTQRMIDAVTRWFSSDVGSIMDIGAGDGRVLVELAKKCEHPPALYAIEKSTVLIQAQPDTVIPVGTDLFEQNLACLPVDLIFCNPPYSAFETWASIVIESGHAKKAFLVIPRRWKDSTAIAASLKRRGATARVIHSDDFTDAERQARAVVDVVEIRYPQKADCWSEVKDPFDIWFDLNIDTFDQAEEISEDKQHERDMVRLRNLKTIADMVAAYDEEYARMETNYRAIFQLDYALLKELGINKENVREGIKLKMIGLKSKYWKLLFERLDAITKRLSTETKKNFLEKIAGRSVIAFTSNNAYAVVLWAIKNANKYFDEQLIKLYRDLSTHENVLNYKSNQRVWKREDWRYSRYDADQVAPTRYALDYRIVIDHYRAIYPNTDTFGRYEYPGDLHNSCHDLIADIRAVLYNLGYAVDDASLNSRNRQWSPNQWQDFYNAESETLYQVKAFKNGNMHMRFMPEAIKAINVEAGRLLGWLKSPADVVAELGYTHAEAAKYFQSSLRIAPSNVRLLTN